MRKKLLSYVLAAVLMSSSAVSAFARDINEASSIGATTGGVLQTASTVPGNYAQGEEPRAVAELKGRITRIFNYSFGELTSMTDADRNVTVFDAGRQRATFGYNFSDGSYTMTNFNMFYGDIEKMSGATGAEKMNNFLNAMGVTPMQLITQKQKFDEKGQKITGEVSDAGTGEYVQVAWLQDAYDALSKGVNSSISINLSAEGGATVTINENGKPQKSLSAQAGSDGMPVVTTEWVYKNGFLHSVVEQTFEVDKLGLAANGGTLSESQQAAYDEAVKALEGSDYDNLTAEVKEKVDAASQFNGVVATYKQGTRTTYMDDFGRAAYDENSERKQVAIYSYSSNGSMNYVLDKQTKSKTYYVGGQPDYIVNEQGFTTAKYVRHTNGTMDAVESYNDGTMTSRTIYAYGKALTSQDMSDTDANNFGTTDHLRNVYKQITATGNSTEQIIKLMKDNHLTSISLYAEHLSNTNLLNALFKGGNNPTKFPSEQTDIDRAINMMRMNNNGYSPVANVEIAVTDTVETVGENIYKVEARDWESQNATTWIRTAIYTDKEGKEHKVVVDGSGGGAVIPDAYKEYEVIYDANWSVEGATNIKGESEINVAKKTDYNGKSIAYNITTATAGTTEVKTTSFDITVMDRGMASFSLKGASIRELGKITPPVSRTVSDPVITGELTAFVGSDGKELLNDNGLPMAMEELNAYVANGGQIYASVKADWANVMDGGLGEAMAGEVMLVQVADTAALEALVAAKGKSVMLMGDVRTEIDGKLTMAMNTSYGGGFITDSAAIDTMKDVITRIGNGTADATEIANNKWVQQNIESNTKFFEEKAITGADLRTKWSALVAANKVDKNDFLKAAAREISDVQIREAFNKDFTIVKGDLALSQMSDLLTAKANGMSKADLPRFAKRAYGGVTINLNF